MSCQLLYFSFNNSSIKLIWLAKCHNDSSVLGYGCAQVQYSEYCQYSSICQTLHSPEVSEKKRNILCNILFLLLLIEFPVSAFFFFFRVFPDFRLCFGLFAQVFNNYQPASAMYLKSSGQEQLAGYKSCGTHKMIMMETN